jgi:hypothetical protein
MQQPCGVLTYHVQIPFSKMAELYLEAGHKIHERTGIWVASR